MQAAPYTTGARPRRAPFWPRRVLLVGGDSVVSRALLVFLRKEGFDAAVVSEDPTAWTNELSGRPFGTAPVGEADVIIVSPHVTGERRSELCRQVRGKQTLHGVPIVTLRDAGDAAEAPRSGTVGGQLQTPIPIEDASIAWPFRLREVLGAIDTLTGRTARVTA